MTVLSTLPAAIEAAARALCSDGGDDPDTVIDDDGQQLWETMLSAATAALSAIQPFVDAATERAARHALHGAADMLVLTPSAIRLAAGELSPDEMRAVLAVLKWREGAIREAAGKQARTVPAGYALVPVRPTSAMVDAGFEQLHSFTAVRDCWSALRAAADALDPPKVQEPSAEDLHSSAKFMRRYAEVNNDKGYLAVAALLDRMADAMEREGRT